MKILQLTPSGYPNRWISVEKAMFYHAKNLVAWGQGETVATYRCGTRVGKVHTMETQSIIAVKNNSGHKVPVHNRITLTNKSLFERDRNLCCYCGHIHSDAGLSRDHVKPVFLGGKDIWENVVTACKNCNGIKGHDTLESLGWNMLYVPYKPTFEESLILRNRTILADQMEFLLVNVPKESRVWKNFT
jgi:5-methylcytosine-specific restriction endonuclease McrA